MYISQISCHNFNEIVFIIQANDAMPVTPRKSKRITMVNCRKRTEMSATVTIFYHQNLHTLTNQISDVLTLMNISLVAKLISERHCVPCVLMTSSFSEQFQGQMVN